VVLAAAGLTVAVGLVFVVRNATSQSGYTPSLTTTGQPDLLGVWQVLNTAAWNIQDHSEEQYPGLPARFSMPAGQGVVDGNERRTIDGVPDVQGYWRGPGSGTEDIEEHPKTDEDDGGKTRIVDPADGKVPYQTWALPLPRRHRTTYVEPNVPCFPSGVPRSLYVPTQIQFLQTRGSVLILFERAHTYRVAIQSAAFVFWTKPAARENAIRIRSFALATRSAPV
jgi:hypothetical protein